MGHTRWATHGAPTDRNAHPHLDCSGTVAVIHNGIIENFPQLRTRLEKDGHALVSETDTELVAHLIEERLRAGDPLVEGVRSTVKELEGAYSLVVLSSEEPGLLVGVKVASPSGGRGRRGRDDPRLRHPRRAWPNLHRDPGGRRSHRRGPGERRDVHGLRRQPGEPGADHGRLGHRTGGEGRLRHLHAEGDPRAACGDQGHAGRPRRRAPQARAGRPPDLRRRAAGGRQGLRGRLRHRLSLRPRREVRDRTLDPAARRDRHRERVPLPRPRPRSRHPDAGRLAVGRDDRHAGGRPARAPAGFEPPRGDEHGRFVVGAGGRRRDLHARGTGDRRCGDQDVRDPDGVAVHPRDVSRAGPRVDVPRGDRRGLDAHGRAAGAGRAGDRAGRPGPGARPAVPGFPRLALHRTSHGLPGRARRVRSS